MYETVQSEFGILTGYPNDVIIRQTKKFGAHTRPELNLVLDCLKTGDTVIDVGAHIGSFAIPIKNKVEDSGSVTAIEANPETYDLLIKNINDNNVSIDAIRKGVSNDTSQKLRIKYRNYEASGSAADYLVREEKSTEKDTILVDLMRLDDLNLDKCDFIKIDVEGMEIDVLQSSKNTIQKYKPLIYTEYVPFYITRAGHKVSEFHQFFKELEYDYFLNIGLRNGKTNEYTLVKIPSPIFTRGQLDFLMVPKNSDRYPKSYKQWYQTKPLFFIGNAVKNVLSSIKKKLLSK